MAKSFQKISTYVQIAQRYERCVAARFVLESSKVTTGISTRHREDFRITKRPRSKNDYSELNENSRSIHLSYSRMCRKKRRRLKTIAKLKNLKDPLIKQFKDEELLPIVRDNGYHSPEFSSEDEVDEKNKIIHIDN
ncbi:hypothetical protein GLOIN_2v1486226 [Rhizophagus clarus]|uniref:Uncharacterized protein n=1 Tax=Rhizophagus clarus TaxID=94130 RepID=A0A8H3LZB9_9GLOM|nr:hypothetical protein GLOIN_2v1486226 [Rhizophagus clarus]